MSFSKPSAFDMHRHASAGCPAIETRSATQLLDAQRFFFDEVCKLGAAKSTNSREKTEAGLQSACRRKGSIAFNQENERGDRKITTTAETDQDMTRPKF